MKEGHISQLSQPPSKRFAWKFVQQLLLKPWLLQDAREVGNVMFFWAQKTRVAKSNCSSCKKEKGENGFWLGTPGNLCHILLLFRFPYPPPSQGLKKAVLESFATQVMSSGCRTALFSPYFTVFFSLLWFSLFHFSDKSGEGSFLYNG